MVTTQIICSGCKRLVLVENKQIVSHTKEDGSECLMAGSRYVPQRSFRLAEVSDAGEFLSHMPDLPEGARVLAAAKVVCEEHKETIGGIALVEMPLDAVAGAVKPPEAVKTQETPVVTRDFSNIPIAESKYGHN